MKKVPNSLINSTSPYLLQHAFNPVNWVEWESIYFEKAKKEQKLLLISIGYSACHWCHVMEKECFEDIEVAKVMNDYFICIKVDREERPDIDHLYMEAVQLMTQQGGWPLNCFVLPNGKPIYGGTYFPKEQWVHVLKSLIYTYQKQPEKVSAYAEKLTSSIEELSFFTKSNSQKLNIDTLKSIIHNWKKNFDYKNGGFDYSPKFPMPNNYFFLLKYGHLFKDKEVIDFVNHTLIKIANGGIYDQLGGGFSRYSVDSQWKIPHFEKMLYDNAQLISLYSRAFQATKNTRFKTIVEETAIWLVQEMLGTEGAYYAAIDADSEGKEGIYYTWSEAELKQLLGEQFECLKNHFEINTKGFWEEENVYVLVLKEDAQVDSKIKEIKTLLLQERAKRIRPNIDDKLLTSWNALLISGFTDAFLCLGEKKYLKNAIKLANWIIKFQVKSDGSIWHTRKNNQSKIDGFLDDYATTSSSLISLYQATFDEKWLFYAKKIVDYCLQNFFDSQSGLFFYSNNQSELITRKIEITDDVIPSSNSMLANNLFLLGHFFCDENYISISRKQLETVLNNLEVYGPSISNWANLYMNFVMPINEVAIINEKPQDVVLEFSKHFLPNTIYAGGIQSKLPVLKDKNQIGHLYLCRNNTCQKPITDITECVKMIKGFN